MVSGIVYSSTNGGSEAPDRPTPNSEPKLGGSGFANVGT